MNKEYLSEGQNEESCNDKFSGMFDNKCGDDINFVSSLGLDIDGILNKEIYRKINNLMQSNNFNFFHRLTGHISNQVDFSKLVDTLNQLGHVYKINNIYFVLNENYVLRFVVRTEGINKNKISWWIVEIAALDTNIRHKIKSYLDKEIGLESKNEQIVDIGLILYDEREQELNTISKYEYINDKIYNEAYPFINQSNLDPYIQNYLNSQESVLLLIGPPGTGKTRLIRHILREYSKQNGNFHEELTDDLVGSEIIFTNSSKVMESDKIFNKVISNTDTLFILEDVDFHLRNRSEGNTVMYKLLSLADGMFQTTSNKIIISTNVDNERDIDQALVRPGRCFDIARFRKLSFDESNELLVKLTNQYTTMPEDRGYYLSEIYRYANTGSLEAQDVDPKIKTSRKPGF